MEMQGAGIVKTTLKKKNKVGGLTLPDFKTCYKTTVIKTGWHWPEDRCRGQLSRTEAPEINLRVYGQLIINKDLRQFNG